ncbi:MAG: lactate racemase domain-containing protein, partial [Candidatus Hodarchaeota archaeon]
ISLSIGDIGMKGAIPAAGSQTNLPTLTYELLLKMKGSPLKEINFDEILKIDNEQLKPLRNDNAFYEALENPINSFSIKDIGLSQKVTIVVNDNTRKVPLTKMIRAVVGTIGNHRKERVRFVIATGTHKAIDPKMLGIDVDIINSYSFYNHDSKDYKNLIYVGDVPSKYEYFPNRLNNSFLKQFHDLARDPDKFLFTEAHMKSPEKVFINRLAVETDLVILIGGIRPHYFAGFSGGAKNLVPGCTGRHFILRNHFYKIHPSATIGNLENNIVRDELEEAALLCDNVFNYNVVLGPENEVLDVVAGHMIDSHRRGASICQGRLRVKSSKFDAVLVTDSWPVTMSVKQIKKVVASACRIVNENGLIVVIGECKEGLGSDSSLNDRVFKIHLGKIKPPGVDIFIHSSVDKKDIELSGFFMYLNGLEHGIEYVKKKLGRKPSVAFIPNGSAIIPEVVSE